MEYLENKEFSRHFSGVTPSEISSTRKRGAHLSPFPAEGLANVYGLVVGDNQNTERLQASFVDQVAEGRCIMAHPISQPCNRRAGALQKSSQPCNRHFAVSQLHTSSITQGRVLISMISIIQASPLSTPAVRKPRGASRRLHTYKVPDPSWKTRRKTTSDKPQLACSLSPSFRRRALHISCVHKTPPQDVAENPRSTLSPRSDRQLIHTRSETFSQFIFCHNNEARGRP